VLRMLFNIRWWLGVALAAVIGAWLPSHFFDKAPSGTVHAQVLGVGVKLGGAYLLAVSCWVVLLAWWATLFGEVASPLRYKFSGATPAPGVARNTQPIKEGDVLEDEIHRADAPKGPVLEGEVLPPETDARA
jgi:hypothetical protein